MSKINELKQWRDELDYMTSNGSEVALLDWAIEQIEPVNKESLTTEEVQKAIDGLIKDITDRRGFRQLWEEIDNDTKDEIKESWANILTALQQMKVWIPVTERLPDKHNPCLVYVSDYDSHGEHYMEYIVTGYYHDGKWHQPHVGYPGPVTHWMFYPEKPKGE